MPPPPTIINGGGIKIVVKVDKTFCIRACKISQHIIPFGSLDGPHSTYQGAFHISIFCFPTSIGLGNNEILHSASSLFAISTVLTVLCFPYTKELIN